MTEQRADDRIRQASKNVQRRGLVTGAAALVVGIIAKQAAQPVLAGGTDNTALIISQNNTSTGSTLLTVTGSGGDAFNVKNTNGAGIYGQSDNSYGVYALTKSNTGTGMYGQATGTSATGVFGLSSGFSGIGVAGQGSGGTGIGVQGTSFTYYGVQGISTSSYGVAGFSGGVGVYGLSSGSYGIVGVTTAGSPYSGITGSANTAGAAAFAGGTSTPGAYAAYFSGPVVVDGSFTVINPANKHGAVKHPDGSYRLLYSMESPESWVEDFGKGQLVNGKATVALDNDFVSIARTDDYTVVPIPEGDCKGLYVANKTVSGFEVREVQGGTSSIPFRYRIVASPKGDAKAQRLAKFTMPTIKIPTVDDLPKRPNPPQAPQTPNVGGQAVQAQPPSRPIPQTSGTQGTVQDPVQPIPPSR